MALMNDIKPKDRKAFMKLLNEIVDIYNGAEGTYSSIEGWNNEWAGADAIAQAMHVINEKYQISKCAWRKDGGLEIYDVRHFDKPVKAAAFLFEYVGVRAKETNGNYADIDLDMNGS